MIDSKLILASKNAVTGVTLYTFILNYPRMILPEVNTHRALSRNTASSRAIPAKKQRQKVLDTPFVPVNIGKNQRGMQAGDELEGWRRWAAIKTWEWSRYPAVFASWALENLGAHKQIVNRIVEPWTYTQQIVTATDLRNVFKLRKHPDAEPHFQIVAKQMYDQVEWVENWFDILGWGGTSLMERRLHINNSTGVGTMQKLFPGEWHLPFVDDAELQGNETGTLKDISSARCGRVSYLLPETQTRSNMVRDLELCTRLTGGGHWSPFEHVATPTETTDYIGNFKSWKQYRKEFDGEHGGDR